MDMVSSITNLGRNGLADWVIQRITALVIGVYVVFLLGFFLAHPHLTYATWHSLFACTLMRVCSLLVLLCICAHAWIGLWTVFTDYIKCSRLRFTLEVLLVLALFFYVLWGASIFWR